MRVLTVELFIESLLGLEKLANLNLQLVVLAFEEVQLCVAVARLESNFLKLFIQLLDIILIDPDHLQLGVEVPRMLT